MGEKIGNKLTQLDPTQEAQYEQRRKGKEHAIKEQNEKLGIAFGILVAVFGDCIRTVEKLRVQEDCHE
ncbi:hypothetical protein VNO77_43405 [Canavalia gladiata]|uniref:DYW domain-containing protein n=1 Tax=Canavalia gladiata TaxID=3824 RepID=A0AAN9JXQ0_CANGL